MTEDKSTRYHRLRRRAELAEILWTALLLGTLVVSGAAGSLVAFALRASGDRRLVAVALLVVGIAMLHELIALPLAWFGGFTLERRYGLSRQSFSSWLIDHLKTAGLALVMATCSAIIIYAILAAWEQWWWLVAGAVFAVLLIALAKLGPVLLLPLFFRLEPLSRETLRARLHGLAARAGAPVLGVYAWTLGDRTRKANAALAGLGRTRRILISDTMLHEYTDDEIEVVLAHELAHHVHHDIWRAITFEAMVILTGFFAADIALRSLGSWAGLDGPGDPAGLPLLALAIGAVSLSLMPLGLAVSRKHERRADRFALDLTANPGAFLSAMRRLGGQNLAEEEPSRLVQWLFYSHPPLGERLAAARSWTPVLPTAGIEAEGPPPADRRTPEVGEPVSTRAEPQ